MASGTVKAVASKTELNSTQSAIAIIADGSTHVAINAGENVYVKNNGTLSEGLYLATANIAANATISSSNVTAASKGLGGQIDALNATVGKIVGTGKGATNTSTGKYTFPMPNSSQGLLFVGNNIVNILTTSGGVLYNSELPSGYTIAISSGTVTLTKTASVSSATGIAYLLIGA